MSAKKQIHPMTDVNVTVLENGKPVENNLVKVTVSTNSTTEVTTTTTTQERSATPDDVVSEKQVLIYKPKPKRKRRIRTTLQAATPESPGGASAPVLTPAAAKTQMQEKVEIEETITTSTGTPQKAMEQASPLSSEPASPAKKATYRHHLNMAECTSFCEVQKQQKEHYRTHIKERRAQNKNYIENIRRGYETLDGWHRRLGYAENLALLKTLWTLCYLATTAGMLATGGIIVFRYVDYVATFNCKYSPYVYATMVISAFEIVLLPLSLAYLFITISYATQDDLPTYIILSPVGSSITGVMVIIQLVYYVVPVIGVAAYGLMFANGGSCIPDVLTTPFYYITGYFAVVAGVFVLRLLLLCVYFALSKLPCVTRRKKKKKHHHHDQVNSIHVSRTDKPKTEAKLSPNEGIITPI